MNKIFVAISLSLLLVSCKENSQINKYPTQSEIIGLASVINLKTGISEIDLNGYFPLIKKPEKVSIKNYPKSIVSIKGNKITINPEKLPALSVLKIISDGIEYSLLLKKSNKIKYTFSFKPQKEYKKVQLMGEMNAWNPQNGNLTLINNVWKINFEAVPGKYQYKIVLDNQQFIDPNNPDSVLNGNGAYNSLLTVGKKQTSKKPILSSKNFTEKKISVQIENQYKEVIAFYNNFQIPVQHNNNTCSIEIPKAASSQKRTFIRVWAYGNGGLSNSLKIPLESGKVLQSATQITRTDFEAAILYNTFVDRFYDADSTNNRPTPDKNILPKANYFGGDIAGITKKIEDGYFKELGINTIWISPIVKNPETAYGNYPNPKTTFSAYHGYWPISFTLIDNRFGTPNEFKKLVKIAHNNNLNVLLDFVANHVHENHPVYKAHPEWATQLHLPDGTLNTERWDEYRLTTWFDTFLPTLDLKKPEVYNMLSDSAVFWIKEYNLDGFRHDATKHIPEIFWKTLTLKLKKEVIIPEQRRLYQIGETYGTPELISSYIGTDMLDAQFDFNTYDAITSSLVSGNSFENLATNLATSAEYYGSNHLMGNISGNQDRGRFISYASGALSFSEDAKLAGWTRNVGIKDSVGYKKSAMLLAISATIQGVPVIYYGDEIGMAGGNDPDNRRMMRFKNLNPKELELKETASKILNFRHTSLPLIYGEFKIIKVEKSIFIYQRNYFNKKVLTLINNSNQSKAIIFDFETNPKNYKALMKTHFEIKNNKFSINLPANSFEIIYN